LRVETSYTVEKNLVYLDNSIGSCTHLLHNLLLVNKSKEQSCWRQYANSKCCLLSLQIFLSL